MPDSRFVPLSIYTHGIPQPPTISMIGLADKQERRHPQDTPNKKLMRVPKRRVHFQGWCVRMDQTASLIQADWEWVEETFNIVATDKAAQKEMCTKRVDVSHPRCQGAIVSPLPAVDRLNSQFMMRKAPTIGLGSIIWHLDMSALFRYQYLLWQQANPTMRYL